MAQKKPKKVSLKPVADKLVQLEKAARKAKKAAKDKATRKLLGARIKKIKRAEKAIRSICRGFFV